MQDYFDDSWRRWKRSEVRTDAFFRLAPSLSFWDLGSAGGTPPPFCWIEDKLAIVNFEPEGRVESCPGHRTPPERIRVITHTPHSRVFTMALAMSRSASVLMMCPPRRLMGRTATVPE